MPSTDNNGLLDKDKFVPSVKSPWLPRLNEAKRANNMLFGKDGKEGKVEQKAMFIILNNEMEKQQADLYNDINTQLTDASHNFLQKYFSKPRELAEPAEPAQQQQQAAEPAEPAQQQQQAAVITSLVAGQKQKISGGESQEEIAKAIKKETLWPKDKDDRNFYKPKTLFNTLQKVFDKSNKNDNDDKQQKELRQLMYKHRTSIYHLIDDKMVETFMDAVDNTNKTYSHIYKKGDTTTYDNIRYVIMWILLKIDITVN